MRGWSRRGGGKIKKVMHEYKHGQLRSGSKEGPKVTNPRQAKAIAMSEARREKGSKREKRLEGKSL
jgi:hypothetical protein